MTIEEVKKKLIDNFEWQSASDIYISKSRKSFVFTLGNSLHISGFFKSIRAVYYLNMVPNTLEMKLL